MSEAHPHLPQPASDAKHTPQTVPAAAVRTTAVITLSPDTDPDAVLAYAKELTTDLRRMYEGFQLSRVPEHRALADRLENIHDGVRQFLQAVQITDGDDTEEVARSRYAKAATPAVEIHKHLAGH